MEKCGYCSSRVIFRGVRAPGYKTRFCNVKCWRNATLVDTAASIPLDLISQRVRMIHQGLCPKCKGSGPIDVHTKFQVWSALIVTSWSNHPEISCRSCGRRNQLMSAFSSLIFGWWGFPWGFIITPVQVIRNVIGMMKGPDNLYPSKMLETMVRLTMASEFIEAD